MKRLNPSRFLFSLAPSSHYKQLEEVDIEHSFSDEEKSDVRFFHSADAYSILRPFKGEPRQLSKSELQKQAEFFRNEK